jgi:hypothetical protein
MRAKVSLAILIAATGVLAAPVLASAQVTAPNPQAAALEKQGRKPDPRKTHKVWTNDEMNSLRSPADTYAQEKEAQAAAAASAKAAPANKQPAPASPPQGGPPALANPRTADEADKMIAWENRDIAAQEEMVTSLRKELLEAPPERTEALQKVLQERLQVLAETRNEAEALKAKKKDLQKPTPAESNAAAAKRPSQ